MRFVKRVKIPPINDAVYCTREPIRLITLGQNRGKASEEGEPMVREPNDFQDTRRWLDLLRCKGVAP